MFTLERLRAVPAATLTILLVLPAKADNHSDDGWWWVEEGHAASITGYDFPDGEVTVPQGFTLEIADPISGLPPGTFVPVISIADSAFEWSTALTAITIPEGVTSLGQSVFCGCSCLTNIYIPTTVTNVGDYAFADCSALNNVIIPDNVSTVGSFIFSDCTSLTVFYISTNVTIFNGTFYGCSSLTDVYLMDGVTIIGEDAFFECVSLATIQIPDTVTTIGDRAFLCCESLTAFSVPEGVTTIGFEAFFGCASLRSVIIPSSVTSIGMDAFEWCDSLTAINVDIFNFAYSSDNGILFDKWRRTLIRCPQAKRGLYSVPNSVNSIESMAFDGCTALTVVNIGNNVSSIGIYAFSGCTLSGIAIPNSLTTIPVAAFADCGLSSITLPPTVTSIGEAAFYNCYNLESVTLCDGTTSIGDWGFAGCNLLSTINIPGSVSSLGSYAFYHCPRLTRITISNGLKSIGDNAFTYCNSLTNVALPSSVTTIGADAFNECRQLMTLCFEGNAPSLGDSAFYGDTALTINYIYGTAGWGTHFGGIRTAPCSLCGNPSLTVYSSTGGTASANLTSAPPGSAAILTATAASGYAFNSWLVNSAGYGSLSSATSNPAIFVLGSSNATVTATFSFVNTATITPLRVIYMQAGLMPPPNVNTPIVPLPNAAILAAGQLPLGLGVVADGVTPVLLRIHGTPGTYSLNLTAKDVSSSAPVSYANSSLANCLFVLTASGWMPSASITIQPDTTGASGTGYAYLQGMNWNSFSEVTAPSNQVNATLTVSFGANQIATTTFGIRPPPIMLVHGIADTGATWCTGFSNSLTRIVPTDFIKAITYGHGGGFGPLASQWWPCTTKDFPLLSAEVDSVLHSVEVQLQGWDFTRYDAVGHSQGGVLLRMLCQTYGSSASSPFTGDHVPVISAANFYRGRFRRIVTIGSPHNGSTLMYYLARMGTSFVPTDLLKYNVVDLAAPAIDKFNPAGSKILRINNSSFPVDTRIPFHCIEATIFGGSPPVSDESQNPPIYKLFGLQHKLLTGHYAGLTRGQVLIPLGSDGVVDLISQGGGYGTLSTEDFTNVAHCIGGSFFGLQSIHDTETASTAVGNDVANLLTGSDSNFGPFFLPQQLTQEEMNIYNSLVPGIHTVFGLIGRAFQALDASTNINYMCSIPADLPLEDSVHWQAVVYGTNGITTNGVSVTVNASDSRQVTLSISSRVVGQVVLSASYTTTNGDLVYGTPVVAESVPPFPGAAMTNIEIQPQSVSIGVGDSAPIQVWGDYPGGIKCLLYTPPGVIAYSSSNAQIATVDTNGNVTLNSPGATSVSCTYGGFTAQVAVSSVAPLAPDILSFTATNGCVSVAVLSSPGFTNVLQASSDLQNWTPVATYCSGNILFTAVETNMAQFSRRFYRVLIPLPSTNGPEGN